MPRWLRIILALAVFVGIMLAVRAVLYATVPTFNGWLTGTFGDAGSLLLIVGFFALCGIYGLWPRDAAGRMRSLLPRRR